MKRRTINLVLGLLCLAVGGFLLYGLKYVDTNYYWYLCYIVFALIVGVGAIGFSLKAFIGGKG